MGLPFGACMSDYSSGARSLRISSWAYRLPAPPISLLFGAVVRASVPWGMEGEGSTPSGSAKEISMPHVMGLFFISILVDIFPPCRSVNQSCS